MKYFICCEFRNFTLYYTASGDLSSQISHAKIYDGMSFAESDLDFCKSLYKDSLFDFYISKYYEEFCVSK